MVFLELRQKPGVYSSVTEGMVIRLCSAMSGLLSSYDAHVRNLNWDWQDNMDASGGEAGGRGLLSSWHSDIGIPINFQEESGILTF